MEEQTKFYYDQFDSCREHEVAPCTDACPFHVDLTDLMDRLEKGRTSAAYKSLRNAVLFPAIVAEVCPAYCEQACIRHIIDTPVHINRMEKSLIVNTKRKKPNRYNLPAKEERIAVIGGGLSGMGFAFKMASHKYQVTVFEKERQIGGSLHQLMEETDFLSEFDLQFQYETYELKTETEITDLHPLVKEYDIIYVATGKNGATFGIPLPAEKETHGGCAEIDGTGVFLGGEVCGKEPMFALADGMAVSTAAENYLKVKRLEYPADGIPTRCVPDEDQLIETPSVAPTEEVEGKAELFLSKEECAAEAARCIRCQCDACERDCDLVAFYKKWPLKMRDEIFLSCKPAGSLAHKSPARKYIAACTDCGLMTETCAEHIDLCGMVKYGRHKMHEAGKVPAAYKQFFLRDMAFANGEFAAVKKAGGDMAFFPGCNLGALDPDYVLRPYRWLRAQYPDTGLLLRCCGIPVDWAGNEPMHEEVIASLRQDWEAMEKPTLITACTSCQKHLQEYLPEAPLLSLYELMAQSNTLPETSLQTAVQEQEWAIFDPCSSREMKAVQKAVRQLADRAGLPTTELPHGDRHGCCGFGGNGSIAAPEFAQYVTERRSALSSRPYLVYCSNCRDVFTDNKKPAIHILDALFDIHPDGKTISPDLTQRRKNRTALKATLLNEFWGETMKHQPEQPPYDLEMSAEVLDKVNHKKVLESDICDVISHAESTGRRTKNPENGHFKAYHEIGAITLWVEYSDGEGNRRIIHNVYTHRMQIKLEAVFNGRKVDL